MHHGECPFRALADAPHIIDLYWFAVSVIHEDERETDLSRQLREAGGESGAVQNERTFGLSIERFWHFWRLKRQRFGIPKRFGESAWEVCAIVRSACEDAQSTERDTVWERRKREKQAAALLREPGDAPPPPVEDPFAIAKAAREAKRARREAEQRLREAGAPLPEKLLDG